MIEVRLTKPEEAPVLAEIQRRAFEPLYERYHDEGNPCLRGEEDVLRRLNSPVYRYFTILDDDAIVGGVLYRCAGQTPAGEELGSGRIYLQRVYVEPALQGKGIAQKAILLCEAKMPEWKYCSVDFPEDLEKNRRCYERAGFEDTGIRVEVQPGLTLAYFEKQKDR